MSEVNEIYYEGYEGEPEIIFIIENNGIKHKMIGVWDGFLNDILSDIKPTDKGWVGSLITGISECLKMNIGLETSHGE